MVLPRLIDELKLHDLARADGEPGRRKFRDVDFGGKEERKQMPVPRTSCTMRGMQPSGSIYCIGRNYSEHARELGNPVPAEPVVFLKPWGSLLEAPASSEPEQVSVQGLGRVDPEVEIVLWIGPGRSVKGYSVGLDFTARDFQDRAKSKGLPWTLAKGLKNFAPIGPFVDASRVKDPSQLKVELKVNGKLRQSGFAHQMLFSFEALLGYLDRWFPLGEGDLVFTGTPPGVGPVQSGDRLEATLSEGDQEHAACVIGIR